MNRKTINTGQVKLKEKAGSFAAVIATLEQLDRQNDIIAKDAFTEGEEVVVSDWNHNVKDPPVGTGKISTKNGREAIVYGQLFMNTERGKTAHAILQGLGDMARFSFMFDVLKSRPTTVNGAKARRLQKLKCYEASPVMTPAGLGTRLLYLKGDKMHPDDDLYREYARKQAALINQDIAGWPIAKSTVEEHLSSLRARLEALTAEPEQPAPEAPVTNRQAIAQAILERHPNITELELMHAVQARIYQENERFYQVIMGNIPNPGEQQARAYAAQQAQAWAAQRAR